MRAAAPAIVTSAACVLNRANRVRGSTAPSRMAAIGGTRVARNAGHAAAMTVTTTPTTRATTIVRAANTVPVDGRSRPIVLSNELRPLARPRPRNSPVTAASRPTIAASRITDQ